MRDGYFFDEHAQAIARRQYLQPGDGDILGMFRRVAREIAKAEREEERSKWVEIATGWSDCNSSCNST